MNAFHSCDGTAIFIQLKMKCSIQLMKISVPLHIYIISSAEDVHFLQWQV